MKRKCGKPVLTASLATGRFRPPLPEEPPGLVPCDFGPFPVGRNCYLHNPDPQRREIERRSEETRMSPQIKLMLGAAVVACATAYLAWLGASTSWQYYVLVDECTEDPDTFFGHRMRVSGRVAADSLQISDDRSKATFVLCGAE